jgi:hypothetical protein
MQVRLANVRVVVESEDRVAHSFGGEPIHMIRGTTTCTLTATVTPLEPTFDDIVGNLTTPIVEMPFEPETPVIFPPDKDRPAPFGTF